MKKILLASLMFSAAVSGACATVYVADGTGVVYTVPMLASIEGAGVSDDGDGVYTLTNDVRVAQGCAFSIEGVSELRFADDVTLTLECLGYLDAPADKRVRLTRATDDARPCGILINYDSEDDAAMTISNLDFEYVQLRNSSVHGFDISDCTFRYGNGRLSSAGALAVGSDGASFSIVDCHFEDNTVPAIGGAANYCCGLYISGCTFVNNNTANTNKPQLNLTVGADKPVTITDCTLRGTGLNMVGGIAVGNLLSVAAENQVNISRCTITDHRYGITGVGRMTMNIVDNTLVDNNHESNPMNGGSGISLAGYGYGLDAIISGNYIENSLWGITLINCREVNLGQVDNPLSPGRNVFVNNGNNGMPYDLYNNQAATVYAQLNTWSVPEQTAEMIETVIYHKADDSKLGEVIFMPPGTEGLISTPVEASDMTFTGANIVSASPITIYDPAGRLISTSMNPSITGLAPGVYIARTARSVLRFKVD